MKINLDKIDNVSGDFDTLNDKLVCVGKEKYGEVSLCFKSNMYIEFAKIKLYSGDSARLSDLSFEDAYSLGMEIARRFNEFKDKK